jgi:hypothetical protein
MNKVILTEVGILLLQTGIIIGAIFAVDAIVR